MKKALNFAALAFAAMILALGLTIHKADARLTGTNPGTDIWCMGPSGAEVCVDSSGNFIPTTTNDASLGTSSLRFSTINSVLGNFSGAITGTSLTLTTGLATASIADSAVTSDKIATGAVTNAKIAADAVTSDKIPAASIGTVEVLDSAITSNKIATGAVTSNKLSSTAVTSNKLSGMSGASASGKLLCGKVDGSIGSCTTASSAVGTVCDICN